jgi:hypothetical protein
MRALNASTLLPISLMVLGGCGSDAATKPSMVAPAAAVGARTMGQSPASRPIVGSCQITGGQVLGLTPPILRQLSTATCQVSHLGRVSVRTVQDVNTITGTMEAEGMLTTASGDLVYTTSLGTSNPTGPGTISFSGVTTIVGGTGRFTNASGWLDVAGVANNTNGTGSFTYKGSIAYNASDRSDR